MFFCNPADSPSTSSSSASLSVMWTTENAALKADIEHLEARYKVALAQAAADYKVLQHELKREKEQYSIQRVLAYAKSIEESETLKQASEKDQKKAKKCMEWIYWGCNRFQMWFAAKPLNPTTSVSSAALLSAAPSNPDLAVGPKTLALTPGVHRNSNTILKDEKHTSATLGAAPAYQPHSVVLEMTETTPASVEVYPAEKADLLA